MTRNRDARMHLGGFIRPIGFHAAWWRYPGGYADANFNWPHLRRFARTLENACFDTLFAADHLALMNVDPCALSRSATATSFDAHTLMSAVAAVTDRIGLVATASTTYDQPYHVARCFAALDHLSAGRAGLNVVTTANPDSAANFGIAHHPAHEERYERAREFFTATTGLWDGWADDALEMDPMSGVFVHPEGLRPLDHVGPEFSVRGPLNVARPVQGWPVIAQAGSSEAGRRFAAEHAELVFTVQNTLADGRQFYLDIHERAAAAGRRADELRILPACFVVLGETDAEARAELATLDAFVDDVQARAALSVALGSDASCFDLDAPVPPTPETNASRSARRRALDLGPSKGLTAGQLGRRLAGYGALSMVGSAGSIVDQMQEWFESGACDGFIILFSDLPAGLDDFAAKVVPELRLRGLFREAYEGQTLRDHLGLRRIPNRMFGTHDHAPRAQRGP